MTRINKVILNGVNFVKKYSGVTNKSSEISDRKFSDSNGSKELPYQSRIVSSPIPFSPLRAIEALSTNEKGSEESIKNRKILTQYQLKNNKISNEYQLKINKEDILRQTNLKFHSPNNKASSSQITNNATTYSSSSKISKISKMNKNQKSFYKNWVNLSKFIEIRHKDILYKRLQTKYFFPQSFVLSYSNSTNYYTSKVFNQNSYFNATKNELYLNNRYRNQGKYQNSSLSYVPKFRVLNDSNRNKILLENYEKVEKESSRNPNQFELEKIQKGFTPFI